MIFFIYILPIAISRSSASVLFEITKDATIATRQREKKQSKTIMKKKTY